jgi:hypothetical protein
VQTPHAPRDRIIFKPEELKTPVSDQPIKMSKNYCRRHAPIRKQHVAILISATRARAGSTSLQFRLFDHQLSAINQEPFTCSFPCAHPRTKATPASTSLCMVCMIRTEIKTTQEKRFNREIFQTRERRIPVHAFQRQGVRAAGWRPAGDVEQRSAPAPVPVRVLRVFRGGRHFSFSLGI